MKFKKPNFCRSVLVMALVITIGYSVQRDNEENSSIDNSTELPVDVNLIFLQMKWPINGKEFVDLLSCSSLITPFLI